MPKSKRKHTSSVVHELGNAWMLPCLTRSVWELPNKRDLVQVRNQGNLIKLAPKLLNSVARCSKLLGQVNKECPSVALV